MRRKNFYVVDVSSDYQILIFKRKDKFGYMWEFFLSDGCDLTYQFGLLCKEVGYADLEEIAIGNFESGNMLM